MPENFWVCLEFLFVCQQIFRVSTYLVQQNHSFHFRVTYRKSAVVHTRKFTDFIFSKKLGGDSGERTLFSPITAMRFRGNLNNQYFFIYTIIIYIFCIYIYMYSVLSRVVVVVLRQYRCKINHNRIFLPPRYPPIGNYAPASLTTYICWIYIFFFCLFFRHRVNEYPKKY